MLDSLDFASTVDSTKLWHVPFHAYCPDGSFTNMNCLFLTIRSSPNDIIDATASSLPRPSLSAGGGNGMGS
ncbi:hypothetical protein BLNAU_1458 [Blattamonas nauphoetae]|uniref:Uncharacterized protein n=1 Tax=Blattamonas nauphoetae TaxID=2049346 RepID=A0ABQ9YI50_9EUKA|nr:hypothetical protein BLNAU_1458 [Blattamonas nauphoetae]